MADVAALQAGYASGDLSPVEATESALSRIAAADPVLHAMQTVYADRAQAAAEASKQRWRAGAPLSPLDGVPVTIKENVDVAGEPTRWGTAATPPVPAERNAPIMDRLIAAGAVVLGKTTMPDWGMLSSGVSSLHPTTRNAWNADWNVGGSSSGAGAATAAGYAPINLGSDIGGSIRLPSHWNGCVGFKPSFGRIPVDPPYIGRTIGPLTRTVADAAAVLRILAGPDIRDPYSLPTDAPSWTDVDRTDADWTEPGLNPARLRIALLTDAGCGTPTDSEILDTVESAATVFAGAGATIVPIPGFLRPELLQRVDRFWRVGHWNDYLRLPEERREMLLPFVAEWCRAGAGLTGPEAVDGSDAQLQIARETLAATADYDLVLSAVSPQATYPADWPMPSNDVEHAMDHIGFCLPYNMSGQPAITVNAGFTTDGRPIGIQLAGRRFGDRELLAAAAFFESERPSSAVREWPRIWAESDDNGQTTEGR